MERPVWTGCDFCGADETLTCMGDVWLCAKCADDLQDEMYSFGQFSWEHEFNLVFESDSAGTEANASGPQEEE